MHVWQPVLTLGLLALARFGAGDLPSLELEADVSLRDKAGFVGIGTLRSGKIWTLAAFIRVAGLQHGRLDHMVRGVITLFDRVGMM